MGPARLIAMRQKTIAERLSEFAKPATNGCVEWVGRRDRQGYGYMALVRDGIELKVKAHRAAFEQAHGPLDACQCVLHRCDNPSCINPAHLFAGSRADNHRDMCGKGRNATGVRHGKAKLSVDQVAAIRQSVAPIKVVAQTFGISEATVSRVKRGVVYAHA